MLLDKLTIRAKDVLNEFSSQDEINVSEFLNALESSSGISSFLLKIISKDQINTKAKISVESLIKGAFLQSTKLDSAYVGTEHLLLSVLKATSPSEFKVAKKELDKINVFPNAAKYVDKGVKTPLINSFGDNLNHKFLINPHTEMFSRLEYYSLVSSLLQKNNSNVLLVGDKGVGKHSLIELLAQNINALNVPTPLVGYQVVEFDLLAFMTSVFNKGGSADMGLINLVEELRSMGRVILSIKNLQNIFFSANVGFTVPMFYSMLKSSLEAANIKIIATMNGSLYDKIIVENDHMLSNFTILEIDEPEETTSLKILEANAKYLSKYHNLVIPEDIVKTVYKKAKTEIKDAKFPKKGIDLLDQACARLIMKRLKVPEGYKSLVDKSYFTSQVLEKSIEKGNYDQALDQREKLRKIEKKLVSYENNLFSSEPLKVSITEVNEALEEMTMNHKDGANKNIYSLSSLAPKIKKKIIGQEHAVDIIVKTLIRSKLGLRSKKRPQGSFLFLGPTGVGKTELAKVFSDLAFGEKTLIRLDMSDFAEKHNVARLVGAPPGYVGYGEGGELTTKIEATPQSVVLFDEIEKAHPDVLNILLQIMEEGELTDPKGVAYDFSQAVIVLTSNLGTEILHNVGIGFTEDDLTDASVEERLKGNLKKIMKPELINRFDEVIVFKRLNHLEQTQILHNQIQDVIKNLEKQSISIKINKNVKDNLLKLGYSKEYGARGLRRIVEKELLDKIAEVLLVNAQRPLNLKATLKSGTIVITSS